MSWRSASRARDLIIPHCTYTNLAGNNELLSASAFIVKFGRVTALAIADLFDTYAVKAVVSRAQPQVVIEQLTALPRTYTRESMSAAAAFNTRIRLEGGANVLAAAQAAGVRRYLRQSIAFWAVPGPGLADEETPLAFDASPAVAADARAK